MRQNNRTPSLSPPLPPPTAYRLVIRVPSGILISNTRTTLFQESQPHWWPCLFPLFYLFFLSFSLSRFQLIFFHHLIPTYCFRFIRFRLPVYVLRPRLPPSFAYPSLSFLPPQSPLPPLPVLPVSLAPPSPFLFPPSFAHSSLFFLHPSLSLPALPILFPPSFAHPSPRQARGDKFSGIEHQGDAVRQRSKTHVPHTRTLFSRPCQLACSGERKLSSNVSFARIRTWAYTRASIYASMHFFIHIRKTNTSQAPSISPESTWKEERENDEHKHITALKEQESKASKFE